MNDVEGLSGHLGLGKIDHLSCNRQVVPFGKVRYFLDRDRGNVPGRYVKAATGQKDRPRAQATGHVERIAVLSSTVRLICSRVALAGVALGGAGAAGTARPS